MEITLIITATGLFSQYAPGVMPRVIEYRQAHNQIPQLLDNYFGYVAVRDCVDIGKPVWLRRPTGYWRRFLAVDCASKSDHQSETDPRSGYQWMLDNNILVELDYATAALWQTQGKLLRGEMWLLDIEPRLYKRQNNPKFKYIK